MATASGLGLHAHKRCAAPSRPLLCWRSTCRHLYSSTAADGGFVIPKPDSSSKSRDDSACSLRQHLQCPSDAFRAGVFIFNVSLPFLNGIVSAYPVPFYFLMAFFPHAQLTKSLLTNARCLIPLALLYTALLVGSWTPESASLLFPGDMETALSEMMAGKPGLYFVPTIEGICQLLSAPMASVSAWAHLQFIAFFCARYIWMDGLVKRVSTVHSILLCAVLPPLAFLSHIFTCFFVRKQRGGDAKHNSGVWPAPAPEADQGWVAAMGGSGNWSSDSGDSTRQAQTPVPGNNEIGESANGTSLSGRPAARARSEEGRAQGHWLTVLEPEFVNYADNR